MIEMNCIQKKITLENQINFVIRISYRTGWNIKFVYKEKKLCNKEGYWYIKVNFMKQKRTSDRLWAHKKKYLTHED